MTSKQEKATFLGSVVTGCVSLMILDGVSYDDGLIVARTMVYLLEMLNKFPNRPDEVDVREVESYIYKLLKEREEQNKTT